MRSLVELYGIDTIQFGPTGSIGSNTYHVLENSGDGITSTEVAGVKNRKREGRFMFNQQFVIGDASGSVKQDLIDAANAIEASVQVNLGSGSANLIFPSVTLKRGARIPTEEAIFAYVVDIYGDAWDENDLIQINNVAGM